LIYIIYVYIYLHILRWGKQLVDISIIIITYLWFIYNIHRLMFQNVRSSGALGGPNAVVFREVSKSVVAKKHVSDAKRGAVPRTRFFSMIFITMTRLIYIS